MVFNLIVGLQPFLLVSLLQAYFSACQFFLPHALDFIFKLCNVHVENCHVAHGRNFIMTLFIPYINFFMIITQITSLVQK